MPRVGAGVAQRGQQVRGESQVAGGFRGPLPHQVVPDGLVVVAGVVQNPAREMTQLCESHEKR